MADYFNETMYKNVDDFIYGTAIKPVKLKNGLVIGGGKILPELNFTLPSIIISKDTMPEVLNHYKEIIDGACKRAVELYVPGFIAEIELLPQTTYHPEWGIEITKVVREIMWDYEQKHGLKSALRLTPVDVREDKNSLHMWKGDYWDLVMNTFEGCANVGAEMLSIESIGGKDVHDDGIMYCDIKKVLFALGILGARDMSKLWSSIVGIANRTETIAAGDTACGFANTAMVLADRKYVPKVFAAIIRVMSAVRSLVAYEEGAIGPHKDCGYEGVYVKAITGTPISMEGKSSACAHLSPVGNIAAAVADLWSNESVQNIKLLGGMTPTISMEQLAYDCRLMNTAKEYGMINARLMRDWLTESDSKFDPQAYVLRPDVVINISKEIIKGKTHFEKTKIAAREALNEIQVAFDNNKLILDEKELIWLDKFRSEINSITDDEETFVNEMVSYCKSDKFDPAMYDM